MRVDDDIRKLWVQPLLISPAISIILSTIATICISDIRYSFLASVTIPPLSVALSFALVRWISGLFVFSIEDSAMLKRNNKAIKKMTEQINNADELHLSMETVEILKQNINELIRKNSEILK